MIDQAKAEANRLRKIARLKAKYHALTPEQRKVKNRARWLRLKERMENDPAVAERVRLSKQKHFSNLSPEKRLEIKRRSWALTKKKLAVDPILKGKMLAAARAYKKRHKDKVKIHKKRDYEKRKKQIFAHQKAYEEALSPAEKERRRILANTAKRAWYKRNKDKARGYCRRSTLKMYHTNPNYRLKHRFRCSIGQAIRRGGAKCDGRALTLLGCDMNHLRKHIEGRFAPEMSWANYGKYWHVDHYIPCSFFNLNREEERLACFNFANLRPMEANANRIKNATLPDHGQ